MHPRRQVTKRENVFHCLQKSPLAAHSSPGSVHCPQTEMVRRLPTGKRLLSAHKKKGFYLLTTVAHSTAHSGCLADRDGPRICPQSAGCPQRQTILCRHLPTAHCLPTAAMGCGPDLLTTETVPTPAYKFGRICLLRKLSQRLLTSLSRACLQLTYTCLQAGPAHNGHCPN